MTCRLFRRVNLVALTTEAWKKGAEFPPWRDDQAVIFTHAIEGFRACTSFPKWALPLPSTSPSTHTTP